jgi:hypothetical protein
MDRGKNRKNQIRMRRRSKLSTALRSLAESPVFGLRRRELFRFAMSKKPSKTAARRDSSLYRWETFIDGKNSVSTLGSGYCDNADYAEPVLAPSSARCRDYTGRGTR